ncbi:membrane protein insertase YidC [Nocardia cyriacigeorgica]|uniref:Membrane protein insertase YidC n=2 Tax=Nocardia cyriacigeorgica TaxID=135487 RepID=H6QZF0_NOCCG|nr:membrane protein insertase YidC [Nocardia cyriacigeorgica]MBF6080523.1 membrane protein insertase YidC [Nocardia cyriacigeorgica]MBF6288266.1 membrane protein insertase YidC [Nocardia cyriacigeorgica]NEW32572.1 membrane protein insertase YidC [Nocardia cyriacigeorgica]CCF64109.1 Membrane protein oxaA [Nocardia cyriacigeorgica GUH-2]BDU07167.1 membrane protein OxaA [Nocardia cyriacigeorgica]
MLDFVYYPVSAALSLWHTAAAAVVGSGSLAWIGAVILLVMTLRAALFPVFLKQARSQAAIRRLQPQLEAIRKKYPDDRQRQATETQKLYREHGVSPFAGCLPLLGQAFVFLGLFHVLRSFDRTTAATHLPFTATPAPMSAEQNAATANYAFDAADVRSFLDADLFGAPLSSTLTGHPTPATAIVAITLTLVAAAATHFTARTALARQESAGLPFMRTLSLWVFPAAALLGGVFLPVAVLLYFVTNNAWTFAQQRIVYRRIDREAAALGSPMTSPADSVRSAAAPRPGARPDRRKRRTPHP